MIPNLRLRQMAQADLPFADSVRALAGWNQTRRDWQRFLEFQPQGCYLAECEGEPAGTATATRYGNQLAWIGMVLVHPQYRRRGIGRALLDHCLRELEEVACVKLDATPLGKPLYTQLGFTEEWSLTRWEGVCPQIQENSSGMQPWSAAPEPGWADLDQRVFGVSRCELLERLAGQSTALVHVGGDGSVDGFGMLRKGARACYLGPVIAASPDIGLGLVRALMLGVPDQLLFWDLPAANTVAVEFAKESGFKPQRPLYRMFRGANAHPGEPRLVFGLADPALG